MKKMMTMVMMTLMILVMGGCEAEEQPKYPLEYLDSQGIDTWILDLFKDEILDAGILEGEKIAFKFYAKYGNAIIELMELDETGMLLDTYVLKGQFSEDLLEGAYASDLEFVNGLHYEYEFQVDEDEKVITGFRGRDLKVPVMYD